MSELKAQILGIILVLGLFAVISLKVTGLFDKTWEQLEDQYSLTSQDTSQDEGTIERSIEIGSFVVINPPSK
jgi:hypothetical protein